MKLHEIDPTLQFLAAGALLFGLSALFRPLADGEHAIRVDRPVLEQYLASGGGETLATLARSEAGTPDLAALTSGQRRELVRKYVEEQALYLEARSWGLGEGDLVIRRRLGQSLRFALRPGLASDPGDQVVRKFYAAHLKNYRKPAETSFDHVYFSSGIRGSAGAQAAARNAAGSMQADWRALGDRFAYQRSYANAGPAMIEAQMGTEFAEAIARLPVAPGRWQGPVATPTGYHLVRIIRRIDAETTPFEQVRPAVLDDWQRQTQADELDRSISAIVDKYRAHIDDDVLSGPADVK